MKRQRSQTVSETPEVDLGLNGDLPIKGKSRACTECQKHKIKCLFEPGQPTCRRCSKQHLTCQVGNSLQKFVTDDSEWKGTASTQIHRLEVAVADILRSLRLPNLEKYASNGNVEEARSQPAESRQITRDASPLSDDGLVPAPMRSLAEVTELPKLGNQVQAREQDLIARGMVTESEAESLFDSFKFSMNQLLWGGIILKHETLSSVRQSSALLCTAILTVTALQVPGKSTILNMCYDEFVSLVAASTLKRHCSLDDIRAMCIGAFWIPGLSWRLSGQAVRWATEINLHQSFRKLLKGEDQHEKTQLWYLLYVCDHHFSIAYGRPPSIIEDAAITRYEEYLRIPQASDGDARVIAQVALFIIMTQVYHQFGVDDPLTESDLLSLHPYNSAIDAWQAIWQPRAANSPYLHTYPSKGVLLHYFFAKLSLNSLALRAFLGPFSRERISAANTAISSALSTLSLVLDDADIRHAIMYAPIFTHTMISYSAMFLLKIALKNTDPGVFDIDVDRVHDLIEKVIALMRSAVASDTHLTRHIAKGLERMLNKFKAYAPQRNTPSSSGFMEQFIGGGGGAAAGGGGVGGSGDDEDLMLPMDQQWHDLAGTTFEYLASVWPDQLLAETQHQQREQEQGGHVSWNS